MNPSSANQISYQTYCQLGGCRNSSLMKVSRNNGNYQYFTYHGFGELFWKQDLTS